MKVSYMTPVVTIFNKSGAIDKEGNKKVYDYLINNGVDGIVLMGSTGEFFTMSMDQKKELIKLACNHIKNRTRLLIGSSCMDSNETIELANYAVDNGAEAVMIIPPYYFALSDESIIEYFDEVANNTKANIYIYNFPDRTGYDIKPEVTLKLARKHKNIIGYKDTVAIMAHTRDLIKIMRPEFPEFEILSGFDDNFVHNVLSGGNGCIGGLSNLVPELTSTLCKSLKEKDFDNMVECQRKIDKLMDLYSVGIPFIPYMKKAMVLKGIDINDCCTKPFITATTEQTKKIKEILENLDIL